MSEKKWTAENVKEVFEAESQIITDMDKNIHYQKIADCLNGSAESPAQKWLDDVYHQWQPDITEANYIELYAYLEEQLKDKAFCPKVATEEMGKVIYGSQHDVNGWDKEIYKEVWIGEAQALLDAINKGEC